MVITHEPGASAEDVLIERYIEPHADPRKSGYSWYRLKERGVPVWTIIGALLPDDTNADAVAEDYGYPERQLKPRNPSTGYTGKQSTRASCSIRKPDGCTVPQEDFSNWKPMTGWRRWPR